MRAALGFLTAWPARRDESASAAPGPAALRWFPLVGAVLGVVLGTLWWAAAKAWPLPVAAVVVLMADLALTGMLHVDGLADAADGLLPPVDRERRLAIMRDPAVGAFGVAAVACTLLARFAVLATLRPSPWLLAGVWCVARTAMAGTIGRVPYARTEGLASTFVGSRLSLPLLITVSAAAAATASAWRVPAGPVAVGAALVAFAGVVLFARHRLGGYAGDVLGAAGVIAETVGLIVAAAHW
jgi:adenosylcobinamide-GDP ribazoletransferase